MLLRKYFSSRIYSDAYEAEKKRKLQEELEAKRRAEVLAVESQSASIAVKPKVEIAFKGDVEAQLAELRREAAGPIVGIYLSELMSCNTALNCLYAINPQENKIYQPEVLDGALRYFLIRHVAIFDKANSLRGWRHNSIKDARNDICHYPWKPNCETTRQVAHDVSAANLYAIENSGRIKIVEFDSIQKALKDDNIMSAISLSLKLGSLQEWKLSGETVMIEATRLKPLKDYFAGIKQEAPTASHIREWLRGIKEVGDDLFSSKFRSPLEKQKWRNCVIVELSYLKYLCFCLVEAKKTVKEEWQVSADFSKPDRKALLRFLRQCSIIRNKIAHDVPDFNYGQAEDLNGLQEVFESLEISGIKLLEIPRIAKAPPLQAIDQNSTSTTFSARSSSFGSLSMGSSSSQAVASVSTEVAVRPVVAAASAAAASTAPEITGQLAMIWGERTASATANGPTFGAARVDVAASTSMLAQISVLPSSVTQGPTMEMSYSAASSSNSLSSRC